jgi:hypothetical protein
MTEEVDMADLKDVSDWFRAAADVEAMTPITAGAASVPQEGRFAEKAGTGRLALAKLVELRRRQCRLSVEGLATQAEVNLEEVVSLEQGEGAGPSPRTVQRVAAVLKLPERPLLELAGLVEGKDHRLREAAVRFAARSEPVEDLRPEEREALKEYVKVLAEA